MPRFHTYYDNLKIPRTASPEAIRAAYRRLSQKHHPDRNSGDSEAARIMVLINVAYGALSDPARRAQHDRWIAEQEINRAVPTAPPNYSSEPVLDPQRYTPKPRSKPGSKPRTRRNSDDANSSFSDGLRRAIRGAFVYHALFLIVVPLLASLASLAMLWPAPATPIRMPIKADVQQPTNASDAAAAQASIPDLTGSYRLIDSNLEHYGSPKPSLNKGKLVIRKLRDNVYVVLEAKTLNQVGTFGYGYVYRAHPSADESGKVVLSRSIHDFATSDGTQLEITHLGINSWETTKWRREAQGFSEKYLDRGIAEAERSYKLRVERGLETI